MSSLLKKEELNDSGVLLSLRPSIISELFDKRDRPKFLYGCFCGNLLN